MVCEHFKANLGQGSKNSFIPLYHANFIASCNFNTGQDEMQGFSLSVLIPFFSLFLWCLPISKCSAAAASQVKSLWKSIEALWSETAKFCTAALQSAGQGFSCWVWCSHTRCQKQTEGMQLLWFPFLPEGESSSVNPQWNLVKGERKTKLHLKKEKKLFAFSLFFFFFFNLLWLCLEITQDSVSSSVCAD